MNPLTISLLRNMLAEDMKRPAKMSSVRHQRSYAFWNEGGPDFDKLIFAIVRDWKASGGDDVEADQLLALLRPTVAMPSVVHGAIAFLDLLLTDAGERRDDAGDGSLPTLAKEAAAALCYLAQRHPVHSSLEDIADGAKPQMSKTTAKTAIDRLISLDYATRPDGPNKGAVATKAGLAAANKVSTKLEQTKSVQS